MPLRLFRWAIIKQIAAYSWLSGETYMLARFTKQKPPPLDLSWFADEMDGDGERPQTPTHETPSKEMDK
jgi:hypothetical protein